MLNITIDHVAEAYNGLKDQLGHNPKPEDVAAYIEGQTRASVDVFDIQTAIDDAGQLGLLH